MLKASGLYVLELKDSTWNYYNRAGALIMSEDYKSGKLHGTTKTYYSEGPIYEIKSWKNNLLNGIGNSFLLMELKT